MLLDEPTKGDGEWTLVIFMYMVWAGFIPGVGL
jgi:hypothetical protein